MNKPPEEIHNVSNSQFSIARQFGGLKYNGAEYIYDPTRDVLVRADVLKARASPARKTSRIQSAKQPDLFEAPE